MHAWSCDGASWRRRGRTCHSGVFESWFHNSRSPQFLQREPHERRVVIEIAFPQPTRLCGQTKEPLETALLHPRRRLLFQSRVEVERRADANHYRRIDAIEMFGHPVLLLRRAQTDPDDVGARIIDQLDDVGVLFPGELSEWRRERAGNREPGKALRQSAREEICDAVIATVEKVTVARGHRSLAAREHQIGTVDAA